MKASLVLSIPFCVCMVTVDSAGAQEAAAPAQPAPLPKRAPGLWRITTVSPELGMQSNDVCIEDGDSIIGTSDTSCDAPDVSRAGDQVIVTIKCGPQDHRDVTSLLFTGDFTSWYRAQSKSTSRTSRSGFTVDAKFLGGKCRM